MSKSNQAATLLNTKKCDSVQHLRFIKKVIYIMRSDMDQNRYRFGGIGVNGNANSAVKRLGQCVKVTGGNITHSWHYLVIAQLPDNTSPEEVRCYERVLRQKMIGRGGRFESSRVPRVDAFKTRDAGQVLKTFREAVKQYKQQT